MSHSQVQLRYIMPHHKSLRNSLVTPTTSCLHIKFGNFFANELRVAVIRTLRSAYLWTMESLIPPAPPRGWYDIECGGNAWCGGPVPRAPDKSDWGCWEEACWPEPTWTDRIAASISFRRCHHLFSFFTTKWFSENIFTFALPTFHLLRLSRITRLQLASNSELEFLLLDQTKKETKTFQQFLNFFNQHIFSSFPHFSTVKSIASQYFRRTILRYSCCCLFTLNYSRKVILIFFLIL